MHSDEGEDDLDSDEEEGLDWDELEARAARCALRPLRTFCAGRCTLNGVFFMVEMWSCAAWTCLAQSVKRSGLSAFGRAESVPCWLMVV